MLANVSLGNERTRQAIVGRVEIAEALSGALVSAFNVNIDHAD